MLDPRQLNSTDARILAFMSEHGGRVTRAWLADEIDDVNPAYLSQRLKRLKEHGHVEQPHRGLWDLVDDPREDETDG